MTNLELIETSLQEELPFRKNLNGNNFSFGVEIEMEKIDIKNAQRLLSHRIDQTWKQKDDDSLFSYHALELASPVLKNEKETWKQLKKLSKTLELLNPVFDHSSFQVNLDMIKEEDLIHFFQLFAVYEKVIYSFSKGENVDFRSSMYEYARPISFSLYEYLKKFPFPDVLKKFLNQKTYGFAINTIYEGPTKGNRVMEFRTPNGTINAWYWQNYINTFFHIRKYVISKNFDKERIEYDFQRNFIPTSLQSYSSPDFEKGLEFMNLIFEEEIDKLYFLKQYLKNNEEIARNYVKEKHKII